MVAACGPAPKPVVVLAKPDRVAIVAAEMGSQGAKLVAIDESGDRRFDLLAPVDDVVRDMSPAISPDGQWMVFASTRGRKLDETNVWIAKLGVEVTPMRLTDGAIDANPTWTPDGRIVFASSRDGGDFDLWRIDRDGSNATQLTTGADHEVTPSVAPDGTIIYASVDNHRRSHIEQRLPDGTIQQLTAGMDEHEPCVSPDGKQIAFTSKVARDDRVDSELWFMERSSNGIGQQVVDLPPTDESSPVWSRDGRYMLAMSMVRGDQNKVLFTSVVFVDMHATPRRARILRDSAGIVRRVTPAVATMLDHTVLAHDPEYLPELANVIAKAIAKEKVQAQP